MRNPNAMRPYQHVMEPLFAYLLIAQSGLSDCFNVGPDEESILTTGELVDLFCTAWGKLKWETKSDMRFREADFLKLDNSKIKSAISWRPKWNIKTAIRKTVEWEKAKLDGKNITEEQIHSYLSETHNA